MKQTDKQSSFGLQANGMFDWQIGRALDGTATNTTKTLREVGAVKLSEAALMHSQNIAFSSAGRNTFHKQHHCVQNTLFAHESFVSIKSRSDSA